MPISHQSIIHKPGEYVKPVDLDLLQKVLQFKQSQYDTGVNKIQTSIDSIAAMDVARDVDKQYLNAKLSNLVGTINNIGGADFSDPNITNQIAGLSSQIYGDDRVINAVGATKKLRYVQGYYKDLKEKKPKDWNPANEWYDMDKFSSWFKNPEVGVSADANAGGVTPQTKYEEDWQKLFGKMTANMKTEITDKGLMYRIDTQKYVTPEQVYSTASKMLTPSQRQQLAIEGRYQYNGLPISAVTKAYDMDIYNKVADAQGVMQDYKTKYKGATSLQDQQRYEQLIGEKQRDIDKLLAPVRKNSEQIKEKLYLDEKLTGLAQRYAYTQASTKLQPATDKMFVARYALDKKKFEYQQQNDALDREAGLIKEGLRMFVDPLTGQRTYIRDPKLAKPTKEGPLDYGALPGLSNAPEEQKKEFSKETLDQRKTDLVQANQDLFRQFVTDLGRKKGLSDVIITDLMDDGHLQAKVDPEMEKAAKDMMASWDAMTRGEKINYDNLDPLFKSFAGKYQENNKEIQSVDKYYEGIDKQIKQKYGVTEEGLQKFQAYQQAVREVNQLQSASGASGNIGQYNQNVMEAQRRLGQLQNDLGIGLGSNGSPAFNQKAIKEYLTNKNTERDQLIASSSIRFNLPTETISDDKKQNLAKMLAGNSGTLQFYNEQGTNGTKGTLNPDNIDPISKGYAYIEGKRQPVITVKYKTGSSAKDFNILQVPLNPQQQLLLGFGSDIQDLKGYNLGLHMNGEVNNINTTSGNNYDLQYDIVKYNVSQQNDPSVFIRVHKGNNIISLYNKPFPSYQHAIQFMEGATKLKKADDAFNFLDLFSK